MAERSQLETFRWPSWPGLGRRLFEWPGLRFLGEEFMDVEEFTENGTFVVRAELPGVDPDKDVAVEVTDGYLHIHAERRHEEKAQGRRYYRSEIRYGAFDRTVPLPPGTGDKDITATYTDGMLEVRVPVAKKEKADKKIPVLKK